MTELLVGALIGVVLAFPAGILTNLVTPAVGRWLTRRGPDIVERVFRRQLRKLREARGLAAKPGGVVPDMILTATRSISSTVTGSALMVATLLMVYETPRTGWTIVSMAAATLILLGGARSSIHLQRLKSAADHVRDGRGVNSPESISVPDAATISLAFEGDAEPSERFDTDRANREDPPAPIEPSEGPRSA